MFSVASFLCALLLCCCDLLISRTLSLDENTVKHSIADNGNKQSLRAVLHRPAYECADIFDTTQAMRMCEASQKYLPRYLFGELEQTLYNCGASLHADTDYG
jgi:hypothetical protein